MSAPKLPDPDLLRRALDAGAARHVEDGGLRRIRFADDFHGVPRGTTIVGGRRIASYPSIGRIFALAEGLARNFDGPFTAEEKIDGYNVRLVRIDGRIVPLTRGGWVCPYTDDRLPDLGDFGPLFDAEPDLVLCGEVAGPENPYIGAVPPRAADRLRFLAFDAMRFDHDDFVPLDEREALFARHGVPRAPCFGWFQAGDLPAIRELVARLDAERSEGLVFKPPAAGTRVKYVTPSSAIDDVSSLGALLPELPGEYFTSRLVRLGVSLSELGRADEAPERGAELGRALLAELVQAVRSVSDGGAVSRAFRVRVRREETVDRLLAHLNRASNAIDVREVSRRRDGAYTVVELEKRFVRSTDWLQTILQGGFVID